MPLLIRREVLDKAQFFEGFIGNGWREESDFEISAVEAGFKFTYCPHVMAYNLPRANLGMGKNFISRNIRYLYFIYYNNKIFLTRHKNYLQGNIPSALLAKNVTLTSLVYAMKKSVWLAKTEALRLKMGRTHKTFYWKQ
jgi:hypothetical protein